MSEGVEVLGASGGGLLVPAADGRHLAVPGAVGYEGGLVDALREELVDAPLPAATALQTGQAIWLESREDRDRDFPALRGFEASTVSMCAVPLSVAGQILGRSGSASTSAGSSTRTSAASCSPWPPRAAQTLQRTELRPSGARPSTSNGRCSRPTYLGFPAGTSRPLQPRRDQEAGGDFYDVIEVAGGRYAAVVGDVMGRGLDAAASMAQVRSTVRAYAVEDPDPVMVFRRVDAFFGWTQLEQLVTMVYLLIDPSAGTVQLASAGHVPPLLVEGVRARAVSKAAEPPFGVERPDRHALALSLNPATPWC